MFKIVTSSTVTGTGQQATHPFAAGQIVHRIEDYRVTNRPTFSSIQVGAETHLEDLGIITYLNHSCRPSTIVDTEALTVRAARDIVPGDDLNFFYPSTEWDMDRPFDCVCGEPSCIDRITGAKHLPVDVLSRYDLSPHVLELMNQSSAHRAT